MAARHILLPAIALLVLAACDESSRTDAASSTEEFASRVGGPAAGPGKRFTGSEAWLPRAAAAGARAAPVGRAENDAAPKLQVIDYAAQPVDIGPTQGGCAFSIEDQVMLIAGAPDTMDSAGRGILQLGGQRRSVVGAMAGGPSYIESGPTMGDGTYIAEVVREAGDPVEGDDGTFQWSATMTVREGTDGPLRTYGPGKWTCGT